MRAVACRALRSAARATGRLKAGQGDTGIFITPGYRLMLSTGWLQFSFAEIWRCWCLSRVFGYGVISAPRIVMQSNADTPFLQLRRCDGLRGGLKGWYVRTAPSLLREDKCRLNGRSDGILCWFGWRTVYDLKFRRESETQSLWWRAIR